jgi:ubiquinone/menaquinone biosynthesis C-methylase UbiE
MHQLKSEPQSDASFRLMALQFKIRDLIRPRSVILKEVGIRPGFHVLDYGCGPGAYIPATARLVTASGKIYALDINPLAIEQVRSLVAKKKLTNVETIVSGCATGLPDGSIDVVLLYDILHHLEKPEEILAELHRVLNPEGILSFNDHHMKDESEIMAKITGGGLFALSVKGKRAYNFRKSR